MHTYYEVFISAETREQADVIMDALIAKRLVTGGQYIQAPAKFLWKGDVVEMDYITITSFTTGEKKQDVIITVETVSAEEVPMIRFVPIEANQKLQAWIRETL
jgi:uncharacterized protein involved in tolerance to divalent cations